MTTKPAARKSREDAHSPASPATLTCAKGEAPPGRGAPQAPSGGAPPAVRNVGGVGRGLRMCISNRGRGEAEIDAARPGAILGASRPWTLTHVGLTGAGCFGVKEVQKSKTPVVKLERFWIFPVPGSKRRFVALGGGGSQATRPRREVVAAGSPRLAGKVPFS